MQKDEVYVEVDETEIPEETPTENEPEEVVETQDVEQTEEISEDERQKRAHFAQLKRDKKEADSKEKTSISEDNPMKDYIEENKINPFTNLPIEDEEDKKDYNDMLVAKAKGYDPTDSVQLAKFKKEQRQQEKRKNDEEGKKRLEDVLKRQDFFANDKKNFTEKYPNEDLTKLGETKDFKILCKGRLGTEPLLDIYEDYLKLQDSYNVEAEERKTEALARVKSSPGSLNGVGQASMSKIDIDSWIKDAIAGKLD